jgi:hypothetical protein
MKSPQQFEDTHASQGYTVKDIVRLTQIDALQHARRLILSINKDERQLAIIRAIDREIEKI